MKNLKNALFCLLFFLVLFSVIYPLFIFGIGQLFFKHKANGSLIINQEKVVIGSELIGQNFLSPKYFHPRPSAAGNQGYDALHSSDSRLSPTSKELIDKIKVNCDNYAKTNELPLELQIPADAVTFSASGLDPHISVENAYLQVRRIAKERNISEDAVNLLIDKLIERSTLEFFGEERINVLLLNLALDQETSAAQRNP